MPTRPPAALRRACPVALALLLLPAGLALPAGAAAQSPDTDIWVARIVPGTTLDFIAWENVTDRPGYDNQPGFGPESRSLFYTAQLEGQTDIFRFELGSEAPVQVTSTPESEYSPTVMPGGDRFSVIRVEADSTQRLWSFALDGTDPALVLENVEPVGYHAWIDQRTIGLFVLGTPSTLQIADVASGTARIRAHDIGRSLHRVPGRHAVSYLHQDGGGRRIRALDPVTGQGRDIAVPLRGSQDYAWTPSGLLLMGQGAELFALDPLTDTEWRPVADLSSEGTGAITRIAVSPDGRWIAVVAEAAGM